MEKYKKILKESIKKNIKIGIYKKLNKQNIISNNELNKLIN